MTEKYDFEGRLVAFTLSPGQEVKILRSSSGLPKQIVLPGGIHIDVRIQDGRIIGLQGPLGIKVAYRYQGQLLSGVTLPTSQAIKLEYDEAQNLKKISGHQDQVIQYDALKDTVSEVRYHNSCTQIYSYETYPGYQISIAKATCPNHKIKVVRKRFDFLPIRSSAAIPTLDTEGVTGE
jgi:hypothetical protein